MCGVRERTGDTGRNRRHYLLWAGLILRVIFMKFLKIVGAIRPLADSSAAALLPNRAVRDARVIGSFRDSPSFHTL